MPGGTFESVDIRPRCLGSDTHGEGLVQSVERHNLLVAGCRPNDAALATRRSQREESGRCCFKLTNRPEVISLSNSLQHAVLQFVLCNAQIGTLYHADSTAIHTRDTLSLNLYLDCTILDPGPCIVLCLLVDDLATTLP